MSLLKKQTVHREATKNAKRNNHLTKEVKTVWNPIEIGFNLENPALKNNLLALEDAST
jgi:hypothetical protein